MGHPADLGHLGALIWCIVFCSSLGRHVLGNAWVPGVWRNGQFGVRMALYGYNPLC